MSYLRADAPPPVAPPWADQRVVLENVSWEQYEALIRWAGERPSLRLTHPARAAVRGRAPLPRLAAPLAAGQGALT